MSKSLFKRADDIVLTLAGSLARALSATSGDICYWRQRLRRRSRQRDRAR